MTRTKLASHPTSSAPFLISVLASAGRREDRWLEFDISPRGDMSAIAWPGGGESRWENWTKGDDLWKRTCFECFVRLKGSDAYLEFNFSPDGQWAAYEFDSYRDGMRMASGVNLAVARFWVKERKAGCAAMLELPDAFRSAEWQIGVSAIIEATNGTKSYWALAHPDGPPDFHDPACFATTLPPPEPT